MPFCPPRSPSQSGSHPHCNCLAPPSGEVSPQAARIPQEEWEEAISKKDLELEAPRKRVLDASMNYVDNIYSMLSRLIPQHQDPKGPQIELLANQIRAFWECDQRWIRPTTHQRP
ncbi:hypothetical protein BGZ49_003238 [Haplosporangium sp. Z 27]|nr:hypothetical protein BGZ49_003238 [Haplosporangium sp. Z 27]